MWQELREELHPAGLEVVTVALDTRGAEAARRWIERAQPAHPSLLDRGHLLDELLGVVNVPSGVWIDEAGVLVRPPEPAFPARPRFLDAEPPPGTSEYQRQVLAEARRIRVAPERYVAALRDWVEHGERSRYRLDPDEVVRRSRPQPREAAEAAAHFELAQHLLQAGRTAAAVPHLRAAHRLQPENWTYKRQAWVLAHPEQGPTEEYEGDWLSEVRAVGPENYYPPLDL